MWEQTTAVRNPAHSEKQLQWLNSFSEVYYCFFSLLNSSVAIYRNIYICMFWLSANLVWGYSCHPHTHLRPHYDLRNAPRASALTNSTGAELILSLSETLSLPRNLCCLTSSCFFNEHPWNLIFLACITAQVEQFFVTKLSKKVTEPNCIQDGKLLWLKSTL